LPTATPSQVLVGTEQHRIRLQGIDAPERKQPYGKASGRSLSTLVAGKQVRVEYDKRDRYGRIIGVVWLRSPDTRCNAEPCPMTLDAGMYQLTVGMAWWYRHYAKEQTPEQRGQYEFAEFEAKAKYKVGLWRGLSRWHRGSGGGGSVQRVSSRLRTACYFW
jgi:endonuclease YncB( thermonuclease family)